MDDTLAKLINNNYHESEDHHEETINKEDGDVDVVNNSKTYDSYPIH